MPERRDLPRALRSVVAGLVWCHTAAGLVMCRVQYIKVCSVRTARWHVLVTSDIIGPSKQHAHVLKPPGHYMQNQRDLKIRCHSVIKYECHYF